MSEQQQGASAGYADSNYTIIIILVAVMLFGTLIWLAGHTGIVRTTLYLRWLEMMPAALFSDEARAIQDFIRKLDHSRVTWPQYQILMAETGRYARYPLLLVLLVLAGYAYYRSPRENFRRRHDMKSLVEQEQAFWPEISPVAQADLINGDITKGPWACSMTEREFCAAHKLLGEDGQLDHDKTRAVFVRQLGPLWRGPKALPPHARAIYAALVARVGKDPKWLDYLRLLASSHAAGKPDYSWVDGVLTAHDGNPMVRKLFERHAYVCTVMATLLQISWSGGIVQSALFLWVKPLDRRLWYVLNNTGRQSFHVEVAGVMSHWLAEKEIGQPLPMPFINNAIKGLEDALKEFSEDTTLDALYK